MFTVAFDESIVGLTFISDLDEKVVASGGSEQQRFLSTNSTTSKKSGISLQDYMRFAVKRGGEDSALDYLLKFNVTSSGVNKDMLEF